MATFDSNYPQDNLEIRLGPSAIREIARQLKEDKIVDAGKLNGQEASYYAIYNHLHEEFNLPTRAGENINQFDVVYISSSNYVKKADNSNTTHADKILGIALDSAVSGNNIIVRTSYIIENSSWDLIPGNIYYLGLNGSITPVMPASGTIQKIGIALTNKKLFIQIGNSIKTSEDLVEREYTAGAGGVNQYDVVYLNGCDIVSAADKNNEDCVNKIVGIALESADEGNQLKVKVEDVVYNPNWNLVCGDIYFVSDNGDITNTVPQSGFSQKIGIAEDEHTLFIQVGMGVVL